MHRSPEAKAELSSPAPTIRKPRRLHIVAISRGFQYEDKTERLVSFDGPQAANDGMRFVPLSQHGRCCIAGLHMVERCIQTDIQCRVRLCFRFGVPDRLRPDQPTFVSLLLRIGSRQPGRMKWHV